MRIKRIVIFVLVAVLALFTAPSVATRAQGKSSEVVDPTSVPTPANTVNNLCASSSPSSTNYKVTVCFTSPASGATLSSESSVTISIHVSGKDPGILYVNYFLNGTYLITAYQSPFTLLLPTAQYPDGVYTISAGVTMVDGYTTVNQPSVQVSFNNSNTQSPAQQAPAQNNTTTINAYTPSFTNPPAGSPFIVTAVGDGADGASHELTVTNELASINPNLLLYLGDVYFSGTPTEFYNNYGHGGSFYSRFIPITAPTVGNHEYLTTNAAGYFGYWNNIPPYYSFNAGGWHFISINSNLSKVGGSSTSSPEYTWLAQDLAANASLCTIAYYHHPLFNIGPEGPDTNMTNIWTLMVHNGVSLVLNGHDHDYQRWVPLDANGNRSATGIAEIIVGTGGHGIQSISGSDSRVAYKNDTSPQAYGVLKLSLASNGATFSYINYAGVTLDSGFVPCSKSGGGSDTLAPSTPSGLTATAASATQVNLAWQASTDNIGVAGYSIYRGGVKVATVSGATLAYADTTVSPSTTYSYTVDAFDAAGNHSAQTGPASVTTPPASQDTQAPSVPTGLTASAASSTQVNLAWQASTDNVGVTGYTIYRGGAVLASVPVNSLSYSDTTTAASTTYSYTVDAFDAAGNHSAQSSPVNVTTPPSTATSMTFAVGEDTYVNSGSASSNFGSSTKWYSDGSPVVNGLLKFSVSGLNGLTPQHAYLHVYANTSSTAGIKIYAISDNTWAENTVTWNSAPAFGTQLGSTGGFAAGTWLTIDVSTFVTGEGTFSFGVSTPGATNISFAAKESGLNAAYLVVMLP